MSREMASIPRRDLSFEHLARDVTIVRYVAVSTIAILIYDYILTIDDEIRLIWKAPFSVPKVTFILNRYVPFIATTGMIHVLLSIPPLDAQVCRNGIVGFGTFIVFSYIIAELILYTRVYALWKFKGILLVTFVLGLASLYAVGLYFVGVFLKFATAIPVIIYRYGCIISFEKQIDWAAFIVLICAETIALVLLVIKTVRHRHIKVIEVIFTDGVIYYVLVLLSSLANVFVLRETTSTLCNMLLPTQASLHSVLCNRLILDIHGAFQGNNTYVSETVVERLDLDVEMSNFSKESKDPPGCYRITT